MAGDTAGTRPLTVPALKKMKRRGQRITVLTAYDATFARLVDRCGIDIVLVGDSLGMVVQGRPDTLSVTVEEMIYHCRAVARAVERAHLVVDMPFMSYQTSLEEGLRNAGRLIKEGRAQAVKIEGGERHADLVARLTEVGIPVMGHIGLTPQSVHAMGGYKLQGRSRADARQLVADASALQQAGAYAIVLESVPLELARDITGRLDIPTIGIGAGPHCDGQVLVVYDLLGMDQGFSPKFVKQYDNLSERIQLAVSAYAGEVRSGAFPGTEHAWSQSEPSAAPTRAAEAEGEERGGALLKISPKERR